MTPKKKKVLLEIAAGADVNLGAQLAQLSGKRAERAYAQTTLALFKQGLLQIQSGGGLEISVKGQEVAKRLKR